MTAEPPDRGAPRRRLLGVVPVPISLSVILATAIGGLLFIAILLVLGLSVAANRQNTFGLLGDKACSVVFDNSKVRQLVPDYVATVPFARGVEECIAWLDAGSVLLSLNRYEEKKNIPLAVRAVHEVIHRHALSSGACARCRLVVAGGYDARLKENVRCEAALKQLARDLEIEDRVVFLRNVTDAQRCEFGHVCSIF